MVYSFLIMSFVRDRGNEGRYVF